MIKTTNPAMKYKQKDERSRHNIWVFGKKALAHTQSSSDKSCKSKGAIKSISIDLKGPNSFQIIH